MPSARAPRLVTRPRKRRRRPPRHGEQRRSIAREAELVVLERPGFPPGPVEAVDFERHAEWVAEQVVEGDHLVGHSYGGVIALLAAATLGERLASLTVIEPPCTRVALDVPESGRVRPPWSGALRKRRTPRPADVPAHLPRRRRLRLRAPHPAPARARAGRPERSLERGPWEADIPARGARRARPPDARRLGRPPRGVRSRSATFSSASSARAGRPCRATATAPARSRHGGAAGLRRPHREGSRKRLSSCGRQALRHGHEEQDDRHD